MRFYLPLVIGALVGAGCAPISAPAVISTEFSQKPATPFEEAFVREEGVRPIKFGGWIKTLTAGAGASPSSDDFVKVNYRGVLPDGTEFDSSYKTGRPASFSLRNVITCWTFGVPMMKVGEKARFLCPAATAYGDAGSPPMIPGKATLVFEIELLAIGH